MDGSAGLGQKALLEMAAGRGNDDCCHPKAVPPLPSPESWAQSIKANGGKIPKPKPGTTIDQWGAAIAASAGGKIPEFSVKKVNI